MSTNCKLTTQRNSRRISIIYILVQNKMSCNSNVQQTIQKVYNPLSELPNSFRHCICTTSTQTHLSEQHKHIYLNNTTTHTQYICKIQCITLLYLPLQNHIPPPPNVEVITYNRSIWRLCNPGCNSKSPEG